MLSKLHADSEQIFTFLPPHYIFEWAVVSLVPKPLLCYCFSSLGCHFTVWCHCDCFSCHLSVTTLCECFSSSGCHIHHSHNCLLTSGHVLPLTGFLHLSQAHSQVACCLLLHIQPVSEAAQNEYRAMQIDSQTLDTVPLRIEAAVWHWPSHLMLLVCCLCDISSL